MPGSHPLTRKGLLPASIDCRGCFEGRGQQKGACSWDVSHSAHDEHNLKQNQNWFLLTKFKRGEESKFMRNETLHWAEWISQNRPLAARSHSRAGEEAGEHVSAWTPTQGAMCLLHHTHLLTFTSEEGHHHKAIRQSCIFSLNCVREIHHLS